LKTVLQLVPLAGITVSGLLNSEQLSCTVVMKGSAAPPADQLSSTHRKKDKKTKPKAA
jgi:hypothetical protein